MKKALLILSLFVLTAHLQAEEQGCAKCQIIREYNATHPQNNPTYYEDYLKQQQNAPQAAPEKTQTKLVCGPCGTKKPKPEGTLADCGSCGKKKPKLTTDLAACGCSGGEVKKPKPSTLLACSACDGGGSSDRGGDRGGSKDRDRSKKDRG